VSIPQNILIFFAYFLAAAILILDPWKSTVEYRHGDNTFFNRLAERWTRPSLFPTLDQYVMGNVAAHRLSTQHYPAPPHRFTHPQDRNQDTARVAVFITYYHRNHPPANANATPPFFDQVPDERPFSKNALEFTFSGTYLRILGCILRGMHNFFFTGTRRTKNAVS
jgi:hypothetical protein